MTEQPPSDFVPACPHPAHIDAPVDGEPVWCRPHADRIRQAVGHLPALAAALFERTLADGGKLAETGRTDGGTTGKRVVSPSGSPAWDAVDEIVAFAGDLEDRLRHHLGHASPAGMFWVGDTRVRATHLSAAVHYLTEWCTALLSAPFAVEAGRRALQLERAAERAAGLDRLRHRLPAPCPSCDRKALVRDDGSEQVDCRACGRVWTEDTYRRLVLILASDLQPRKGA